MPRFYLDIETAPLEWSPQNPNDTSTIADPDKNKIITIQFQKLAFDTGKPIGELQILKEWESSEEEIVNTFLHNNFLPVDEVHEKPNIWYFVPVGNNLDFEWQHLTPKFEKYCGIKFNPYLKPTIDIKSILITINGGAFTGSHHLVGKSGKAKDMAMWYHTEDYSSILDYIVEETEMFLDGYQTICQELPLLKKTLEKQGETPTGLDDLR